MIQKSLKIDLVESLCNDIYNDFIKNDKMIKEIIEDRVKTVLGLKSTLTIDAK